MTVNVLQVVPLTHDSEIAIFVRRQLASLEELGVQSEVFGVRARDLGLRPLRLLRTAASLRAQLRSVRPDLVHAHNGSLLGLLCAIAVGNRTPMVLTVRGSDVNRVPREVAPLHWLRLYASRFAARRARAVVAVSHQLLAKLEPKTDFATVISDGVDDGVFYSRPMATARAELGWSADDPVALFHEGRRPLQKGRPFIEEVISRLKERDTRWRLEVLQNDASPEEVAQLMAAASCLLFASLEEGSPNIVRESLRVGCPVVSVDVGDVGKWVGLCSGLRLAPRDARGFAREVEEVVKIGGRNPCLGLKSMKSAATELLEVYDIVVTEPNVSKRPGKSWA